MNKDLFKTYWHELNAFLSGLSMYFSPNKALRSATNGYLLKSKTYTEKKFIKRIAKLQPIITTVENFKKVQIANKIYYWPIEANLDSLMIVLGESLIKEHPHYYNSGYSEIKKGDRVLDIGACEGAFTLDVAPSASYIVAVEPSHTMIKAINLSANDMNFKNIECVPCLLGPENGTAGFFENINAPEASIILEKSKATEFREVWTLDYFIDKHFQNGIDYIKCDAEGVDYDILKSGINTIKKYKPRIAIATYHDENDFNKIQKLLENIDYSVKGQGIHYSYVHHKCWPVLLKAKHKSDNIG